MVIHSIPRYIYASGGEMVKPLIRKSYFPGEWNLHFINYRGEYRIIPCQKWEIALLALALVYKHYDPRKNYLIC
jgi:hypothetical protein